MAVGEQTNFIAGPNTNDPDGDELTITEVTTPTSGGGVVITTAGPLDPDAFWPYADTIGGSRWPGDRGGRLGFRLARSDALGP